MRAYTIIAAYYCGGAWVVRLRFTDGREIAGVHHTAAAAVQAAVAEWQGRAA